MKKPPNGRVYSINFKLCNYYFQYLMIFSTGKYRKESLKISVKAVDTRSFIKGLMKGKAGCHALLMKKPATFSITLMPPKRSLIFSFISPSLSMNTRTFSRLPGPPSLRTIVVWAYLYRVMFQLPEAFRGFPRILASNTYWPSSDFSGNSCEYMMVLLAQSILQQIKIQMKSNLHNDMECSQYLL